MSTYFNDHEIEAEMPTDIEGLHPNEIWVSTFDNAAAKNFASKVFAIARTSENDPIVVYLNTMGGEIYNLLTMISALDAVPNTVITVAMGAAFSSGAILLSHGDHRYVSPHARIMVHEAQGGAMGHIDDVTSAYHEMHAVNTYGMELLAKNCGIKGGAHGVKQKIAMAVGREVWMNAKMAIDFGIADSVGIPRLSEIIQPAQNPFLPVVQPKTDIIIQPRIELNVNARRKKSPKK